MAKQVVRFCIAEYCPGPFYMGWWLYERETNDGRPNTDGWGWMRSTASWSDQQELHALCQQMGHTPPPVARHTQDFAEWFAATFPSGLRVAVYEDRETRYELIEIIHKRPRQRRGVIRTITGAAMADRAGEGADG